MAFVKRAAIIIIALFISAATLAEEPKPVGLVLTASGTVEAVDKAGQAHTLGRKSKFYEHETIITGDKGKAKLRFIDGNIVSLSPKTEFVINEYNYNPDKAARLTKFLMLQIL